MERKTLLVDLDAPVYPWLEMMAQVISAGTEIAADVPSLLKLHHTREVWKDWGIPKGVFDWWWEEAIRQGVMYAQGPPVPASVTALWRLSDMEWNIHIVTARLNKFRLHDRVVESTAQWLRNVAIPYRSLTFTDQKDRILGDAIIDDHPDNLLTHPAPIKMLYPTPANREFAEGYDGDDIHILVDDPDLHAWDEVVDLLGGGEIVSDQLTESATHMCVVHHSPRFFYDDGAPTESCIVRATDNHDKPGPCRIIPILLVSTEEET